MIVKVLIPARDEEKSIAKVIGDIPPEIVSEIVVVNNGSKDYTAAAASIAGATVIDEPTPGYGAACLKGIDYLKNSPPDILVFMDGDYSDHADEIEKLIRPIQQNNYDFVVGSRTLGAAEKGAFPLQSKFGNLLASYLVKLFWKFSYTDLGPFRAIKFDKLLQLQMQDVWFGWTVEMQIKALKNNLKVKEVPVSYRKRIGKSKVSGTIKGAFLAGAIILKTIFTEVIKKDSTK